MIIALYRTGSNRLIVVVAVVVIGRVFIKRVVDYVFVVVTHFDFLFDTGEGALAGHCSYIIWNRNSLRNA